jgi:hypothetical protein
MTGLGLVWLLQARTGTAGLATAGFSLAEALAVIPAVHKAIRGSQ